MEIEYKDRIADFHVRLGRVEQKIESRGIKKPNSVFEQSVEIISATFALVCAYIGFGIPNHYYQYIFSALIVSVLYHREIFPRPKSISNWFLVVLNLLLLSMLLKLVIGGGDPKPFFWFSYPTIEGGLTSFKITWQQTDMAQWALPLTTIQTFFFVITLFGSLIGFEVFCALTSFILVLLSLPALVTFNWTWALPAMITALFCFYMQSE